MIESIEKLASNSWPPLDTHFYDGWLMGVSDGYTRRANSIQIFGNSKILIDDKIKYCEDFYRRNRLPAIFKIVKEKGFEELDTKLKELNYNKVALTSVRLKKISGCIFTDDSNIEVSYLPSKQWVDKYFNCANTNLEYKDTYLSIINKIKGKSIWATYAYKGKILGLGFATIEKGYCGIYSLIVDKGERGRGYAKALMNKLLLEAQKLGATMSYLQVTVDNRPAKKLYDKFGYEEIYRYYYRKLDESTT